MTALLKDEMNVDQFLAWAAERPERRELFDGVPVAMAPERAIHVRSKARLVRTFEDSIANAGLPCEFLLDGMAVQIDHRNMYQPDGMVRCGELLSDDALVAPDPVIVVEVLSPGNAMTDLRDKLQGHFRVPFIQHYLIVDPDKKLVIHHARGEGDVVATRIVSEGSLPLEPPGLTLPVAALFGES